MCGIVGAITERNAVPVLLEGLHRLEYRGYDSAGIACYENGGIARVRSLGKVEELESAVDEDIEEALASRHLKFKDKSGKQSAGFTAFAKRITTKSDLSKMTQDEKRRLYSVITGFKKQDSLTDIPLFEEKDIEKVVESLKGKKITLDSVRQVLKLGERSGLGSSVNNSMWSDFHISY